MFKAKKIRLDVSAADAAALEFMQGKCRGLYNWLVMRLRAGERWRFAEEKARLSECRAYDLELNAVYGKLLAEVYFRLDKAMQAFFRRVQAGETPGFPRVRPRHQFFTLCYPAAYLLFEGKRLILPTGGKGSHKRFPKVVAALAEVPPCGFREVAISRDARGHYYASFVYEAPEAEPQPAEPQAGQVVAFDLGLKTLAVGVNEQGRLYHIGGEKGHQWYVPSNSIRFVPGGTAARRSRDGISISRRSISASRSRSATNAGTACIKPHISSLDPLVESTVVIGDLSQRQMVTKEHTEHLKALHRSVYNDWGLYSFVQMLTYKCLLAGKTSTGRRTRHQQAL